MRTLQAIGSVVFFLTILVLPAHAEDVKLEISAVTNNAVIQDYKEGTKRVQKFAIIKVPAGLEGLKLISAPRGSFTKVGTAYSFKVNKPITVYLLVDNRGAAKVKLEGWTKTKLTSMWAAGRGKYKDIIYKKDFPAGEVKIPETAKGVIPFGAVIKEN